MAGKAGEKVNEAAQRVGDNLAHAADWVKDKTGVGPGRAEGSDAGVAGIREHMEVVASCGTVIGEVDRVEGNAIKLTKDDGDGQHHYLPLSMVSHVDRHVHLKKNSREAIASWKPDADSCGCG